EGPADGLTPPAVWGVRAADRPPSLRKSLVSTPPPRDSSSMAVACPSCGAPADADARFCSRCGRTLAAGVATERRAIVTVLFCDLVESTKLGERVDPELLREIQAQYFSACSVALQRHGG